MNLSKALKKAHLMLNSKEDYKAINFLKKLLINNPESFEIIELLALIYIKKNQDKELKNLLVRYENNQNFPDRLSFHLGLLYIQEEKYFDAIKIFHRLDARQNAFEIKFQLGLLYTQLKDFEASVKFFREAYQLDKNSIEIHINYGAALRNVGEYEQSISVLLDGKDISPCDLRLLLNLGVTQDSMGRHLDAIETYRRALDLDKNCIEALTNLGNSYLALGNFEQAKREYAKAISINPHDSDSLFFMAMMNLSEGNYSDGWINYEKRFNSSNKIPENFKSIKRLTDLKEANSNKTILIWSEQGFGDTIQFSRYLPDLIDKFKKITFLVQPELCGLMHSLAEELEICSILEKSKLFDYQIPLLSLPLLHKTNSENIPAKIPYLMVDPVKNMLWKDKLTSYHDLKVGIVWNGGFRKNQPELWGINARRNVPFREVYKLLNIKNINFFVLQKRADIFFESNKDEKVFESANNVINFSEFINDFTDTAAFINNLDLVIAVDTAVVHLAGALGKPVWVMNRLDSCWRWIRGGRLSAWYPTARIFNQKKAYDWSCVINEIEVELNKLIH